MHIEKFEINLHMDSLISVLTARDTYIPTTDEMPKIGFVAFERGTPVSFGFLRAVEGGGAIVDGLTSNPQCSSVLRNEGNNKVINACIETAKSLKFRTLIAFTLDDSTLKRSIRHGFAELQHTCLAYDLNRKA